MSLTPEQRAAFLNSSPHPESETSQDEFSAFAAGIAHERARCAKVCRELQYMTITGGFAGRYFKRNATPNDCAAAINYEAPADGGQPGE